jgi:NAD(P)-dependent dehydrogenase (short-subunit alcohol dehydrogenase family)
MKTIIITGSTRGIGYGLADEFLKRGQKVVVSGRSQDSVDTAVTALSAKHGSDRLQGNPCNVAYLAQNQALWDAAVARFGKVDIWINNAGINHPRKMIWEVSPEDMQALVDVNLLGTMYGSQVAMRGMIQQGHGHIYNMEGSGSNGAVRPGVSVYGATKRATHYFTHALEKEAADNPVKVSSLSPGIVITDMILDPYKDEPMPERAKRIFNILGDKVETVTPWLAEKVLANEKSGAHIAWLTTPKILFRFMTAGFNKRDLFT